MHCSQWKVTAYPVCVRFLCKLVQSEEFEHGMYLKGKEKYSICICPLVIRLHVLEFLSFGKVLETRLTQYTVKNTIRTRLSWNVPLSQNDEIGIPTEVKVKEYCL